MSPIFKRCRFRRRSVWPDFLKIFNSGGVGSRLCDLCQCLSNLTQVVGCCFWIRFWLFLLILGLRVCQYYLFSAFTLGRIEEALCRDRVGLLVFVAFYDWVIWLVEWNGVLGVKWVDPAWRVVRRAGLGLARAADFVVPDLEHKVS